MMSTSIGQRAVNIDRPGVATILTITWTIRINKKHAGNSNNSKYASRRQASMLGFHLINGKCAFLLLLCNVVIFACIHN